MPEGSKQHETFSDCINEKDLAFSFFSGTGQGYCHHCKTWHENAVEKERHARGGKNELRY